MLTLAILHLQLRFVKLLAKTRPFSTSIWNYVTVVIQIVTTCNLCVTTESSAASRRTDWPDGARPEKLKIKGFNRKFDGFRQLVPPCREEFRRLFSGRLVRMGKKTLCEDERQHAPQKESAVAAGHKNSEGWLYATLHCLNRRDTPDVKRIFRTPMAVIRSDKFFSRLIFPSSK